MGLLRIWLVWTARDRRLWSAFPALWQAIDASHLDVQVLLHDTSLATDDAVDVHLLSHVDEDGADDLGLQVQDGRPDISSVFHRAAQHLVVAVEDGAACVGVFTCGPRQLCDSVEVLAKRNSSSDCYFEVHRETFQM